MSVLFPEQVRLDPDEVRRVNRVRLAREFSVTPAAIDALPASDVDDMLQVLRAEAEIERKRAKR